VVGTANTSGWKKGDADLCRGLHDTGRGECIVVYTTRVRHMAVVSRQSGGEATRGRDPGCCGISRASRVMCRTIIE